MVERVAGGGVTTATEIPRGAPTSRTGIVRAPRRPYDWCAPGPAPRVPPERADVWPGAGEDLCHLAGDWRILQRVDGHRWSLDDLVTAWCAAEALAAAPTGRDAEASAVEDRAAAPRRFADLGCGIGAVLLLLAWRFPHACGAGVEAQATSVGLARRSLAWNGADDRCVVVQGDFRAEAVVARVARAASGVVAGRPAAAGADAVAGRADDGALASCPGFDLVTGTPPYLPPGTAVESTRVQRGPCRIEHRGGVEVYCETAARLLAPDGVFVTCAGGLDDPARVPRAADAAGLVVIAHRDVVPRAGKAPLFGVHVMRRREAGPSDGPVVAPPLVVRDTAGAWTDGFRAVRQAMGMPA